jgi:hypothetical protein
MGREDLPRVFRQKKMIIIKAICWPICGLIEDLVWHFVVVMKDGTIHKQTI